MTHQARQLARLRAAMQAEGLEAVHLVRPENLAWLTGARTYISLSGERGALEVVVTPTRCTFISNAIEAARFEEEEGVPEVQAYRWWEAGEREALLQTALDGRRAVSDVPSLPAALEQLRWVMEPPQDDHLKALGNRRGRCHCQGGPPAAARDERV